MITFRLTVEQFRVLLEVVLGADAPDHLTNLVLMACSRPRDGVISIPVPPPDAAALRDLVAAKASEEPQLAGVAALMAKQVAGSSPS
jgi:hypothetical protein